jgi:ABC-2 type transport system permease protein
MIARIARKEMTEMLRDGRFRWTAIMIGTLLVGALTTGASQYLRTGAERDNARRAARDSWLTQAPKNAHAAAHYGLYAFKPVMPLSLVDEGVDRYVGVFAWLEAHKQNDFKYRPAQDATVIERFGTWTAAAVLQILIPLIIVLAAFPAFVGEREQGTLRQLLATGVGARDLVLGKAAGVSLALATFVVPAAIVGALALVVTAPPALWTDTWLRVAFLALVYVLYFAGFLAVSLAVSLRARSTRFALIVLLAFWVANAFVAPRAAVDLARRARPAPSALAFNLAMERDLVGSGDGASAKALEDSVLKAHGMRSLDSLPFNFAGLSLQRGEEHGYGVFDERYGELATTFAAQDRLTQRLGIIAPLLATRALSMGLAGTDYEQHHDFAEAAESYRRALVKAMNDAVLGYRRSDGTLVTTSDSAVWASVPPFRYEAMPLGVVMGGYRWALGALVLWFAASLMLAVLMGRRVSPLTLAEGRAA